METLLYTTSTDVESFIYKWNMDLDFGDDLSRVPDLQQFHTYLLGISNEVSENLEVYNAIVAICQSAITHGNNLYFMYE